MDPLRSYLDEIIRGVVPKSWEVRFLDDKNIIGIDNKRGRIGWGLSWQLDEQRLKVACGTSSITVDIANPNSRQHLIQFFRWLTRKGWMDMPEMVVIERREREDEDYD